MDVDDYKEFVEMLDSMAPTRQYVFLNAVRLFMECCVPDAELSAILIVKRPALDEYTLNIAALNADIDDAYELLNRACTKVAEDIKEGAPDREMYN